MRTRALRSRASALALLALAAASAAGAATQVTTEPSPIILGRTPVVSLTLLLDPALAAAPGKLHVSANVGELGNPSDLGGGRAKMSYAPPPTKFPQMALLAVWKESPSPTAVEFVRLPLNGVSKVEASSRPGAEVSARVGDQTYGPAIAGKGGEAVVSVIIAPGTQDLVLLAKVAGVVTERVVAVDVPPYNRLAAVVTPSTMGRGPRATARLDVLYDVNGEVDPAQVHARASSGTLTFERLEGTRLSYRWEASGEPKDVTFNVTAEGDPASSAAVALRKPPDTGLALRVGGRVGITHSLGELVGPRYGLDAWATMNPGGVPLGLGLTAGYGSAAQQFLGPTAAPFIHSEVTLLPLAVRAGFVPVQLGGVTLLAGAGFTATVTRYRTFDTADDVPSTDIWRLAPSALLFAGGTLNVGPGQLFGEAVLSWAAVNDSNFRVQAGGVGVEVGYRFDVLRGG